jgi:hypothetical protein
MPQGQLGCSAHWQSEHPGYRKQYHIENREEENAVNKEWRVENPEKAAAAGRKWRTENPEKSRATIVRWRVENPEQDRACRYRHNCKHRTLGFIPLNSWFLGGEAHHINKSDVIYMPHKLHRSIYHNLWTGKGMAEINALAGAYLTEDWT